MTVVRWGRALLFWGLVGALLSAAPFLLLSIMPDRFGTGFIGLLAIMLSLSVTPLAVAVASAGAILLLVALVRRRGPP
ncbi:MAG TPA: hypothetical protein GYA10_02125 [Alphaproteobacteria bacterium]|nr:hypothetical protein [Alphaproteobacteria bacterium]